MTLHTAVIWCTPNNCIVVDINQKKRTLAEFWAFVKSVIRQQFVTGRRSVSEKLCTILKLLFHNIDTFPQNIRVLKNCPRETINASKLSGFYSLKKQVGTNIFWGSWKMSLVHVLSFMWGEKVEALITVHDICYQYMKKNFNPHLRKSNATLGTQIYWRHISRPPPHPTKKHLKKLQIVQ